MNITKKVLDDLTLKANESPRLRMHLDMRNSGSDHSQRMLNALEPGTILPIHRHRDSSESVMILRGKAVQYIYDDSGNVIEEVTLAPNSDCIGMNVPVGVWHRLVSLESGTVIFESKDGAYKPLDPDDILS